jgi:hypothetical protein
MSKEMKRSIAIGIWCILQVILILWMSVVRLVPLVAGLTRPENMGAMSNLNWFLTIVWCLVMGYCEGYRGFYCKFSPVAVDRAFSLDTTGRFYNIHIILLGGPYAMGLFMADKKRLITSWLLFIFIFWMIAMVKKLSFPYREMVDAGVLVGITLGMLSLVWHSTRRIQLMLEAIKEFDRVKASRKDN